MSEDLVIDIGANVSGYTAALLSAEKQFKKLSKKLSAPQHIGSGSAKEFAVELNSIEKKSKKTLKNLKYQMADALNISGPMKEWSKKQKAMVTSYANHYKRTMSAAVESVARKKEEEALKSAAFQRKVWALQERQALAQGRAVSITQRQSTGSGSGSKWGNIESFKHAAKTTALYGGMAQVLFGVQNAFSSAFQEMARFDQGLKDNQAVLQVTAAESLELSNKVTEIGIKYGASLSEIQEGMITFGRAGVDNIELLKAGTESLAALSVVTGDAMQYGAKAMASMIAVYPKLKNSMGGLADKMGAIANATRLGLEDFTTISNYALTSAKTIGLTSDSYLALVGAMSKVGVSASSIGTSIARFTKLLADDSKALAGFFEYIDVDQNKFAQQMKEDSEVALPKFIAKLVEARKNTDGWRESTAKMDIRMRKMVNDVGLIGEQHWFKNMTGEVKEAKSVIDQARLAAKSLSKTWRSFKNTMTATLHKLTPMMTNWAKSLIPNKSAVESTFAPMITIFANLITMIDKVAVAFASWFIIGKLTTLFGFLKNKLIATRSEMALFGASSFRVLKIFTKQNILVGIITGAYWLWNKSQIAAQEGQEKLSEALSLTSDQLIKMNIAAKDAAKLSLVSSLIEANREAEALKDRLTKLEKARRVWEKITGMSKGSGKNDRIDKQLDNANKKYNYQLKKVIKIEKQIDNINIALTSTNRGMFKSTMSASKLALQLKLAGDESDTMAYKSRLTATELLKAAKAALRLAKNLSSALTVFQSLEIRSQKMNGAISSDAADVLTLQLEYNKAKKLYYDTVAAGAKLTGKGSEGFQPKILSAYNAMHKIELDLMQKGQDINIKSIEKESELHKIRIRSTYDMKASNNIEHVRLITAKGNLEIAKEELKLEKKLQQANPTSDYDIKVARAEEEVKKAKREVIKASAAESKKANKAALSEYMKMNKAIIADAKKTVDALNNIFKSGLSKIFHGDFAGGISDMFKQLMDKLMRPAVDYMSTKLTKSFVGMFGTDLQKQVSTSIHKGVTQGMTQGLSSKLTQNAFTQTAKKGSFFDKLGRTESGGDYSAWNDSGGYAGKYQFNKASAEEYLRAIGKAWSDYLINPSVQEQVVRLEMRNIAAQLTKRGIPKTELNMWGAHNLGVAGYSSVYNGTATGKYLSNMRNQTGMNKNSTTQDYLRYYSKIFNNGGVDIAKGFNKNVESTGGTIGDKFKASIGNLIGVNQQGSGGGANMSAGLSSVPSSSWIVAAIQIAGALFSSTLSEAELKAAKGRSEFDDDSLKNLQSVFEAAQYPMLDVTNSMDKHLRNMDENFYAVAMAFSANASAAGIDLTGANFVGEESNVLFGLFSSKTSLIGTGFIFEMQNLKDMMDEATLSVRAYTTVRKDSSFLFGLFSSSSIRETYQDLPDDVIKDMSNSFSDGYMAILEAGVSLGLDEVALRQQLLASEIDIGKVDFTGLSQEEIQNRISQMFGTALSGVVDGVEDFSILVDRYAKNTEESLETLIRIAVEYDQASHVFGLLGKDFNDATTSHIETVTETLTRQVSIFGESLDGTWFSWLGDFFTMSEEYVVTYDKLVYETYTAQQQILDIVESTGGLTQFNDAMSAFMGNFYTDAEQVEFLNKSMQESFSTLGLSMPKTNDEFRSLLENMDTTTEEGSYLYGQVLLLADSFNTMTTATEDLGESMTTMIQNVSDAWLGNLSYLTLQQKAEYASGMLSLGMTDSSGAINSVDSAQAAAEVALKSTATKAEYIPVFDAYIKALEDEVDDASRTDLLNELRDLKAEVVELKDATILTGIYGTGP